MKLFFPQKKSLSTISDKFGGLLKNRVNFYIYSNSRCEALVGHTEWLVRPGCAPKGGPLLRHLRAPEGGQADLHFEQDQLELGAQAPDRGRLLQRTGLVRGRGPIQRHLRGDLLSHVDVWQRRQEAHGLNILPAARWHRSALQPHWQRQSAQATWQDQPRGSVQDLLRGDAARRELAEEAAALQGGMLFFVALYFFFGCILFMVAN